MLAPHIHSIQILRRTRKLREQGLAPATESWVAAQARSVLADDSEQVIADIRTAAKTAVLGEDKLKTIEAVCGYLESKSPYLRYDTALTRGWPIATGIIEGACRHLVKDRLDITGARWSLAGAEAVLKLRALISNGDFNPYYAWHLKQEHRRVHQARYQDRPRLAAPRASTHSRTQHQAA